MGALFDGLALVIGLVALCYALRGADRRARDEPRPPGAPPSREMVIASTALGLMQLFQLVNGVLTDAPLWRSATQLATAILCLAPLARGLWRRGGAVSA